MSRQLGLLGLTLTLTLTLGFPVSASTADAAAGKRSRIPALQAPRSEGSVLGPNAVGAFDAALTSDTLSFGYIDGSGFAIEGDTWTFDHGGADPFEGWYGTDVTEQATAYWRQISTASWDADPNNTVSAPILAGAGSAWCGAFGTEANDLCWEAGLGYGNSWCQRLISPTYVYSGSGSVPLSWKHFNDTETDFDYTVLYLRTLPSQDETEILRYTDQIGLAGDHPSSPPVGVDDSDVLVSADFSGETSYQILIEMTSDSGWSDEDALYATSYGPCGFDNVDIDGNVSTFEAGLGGWTAEACDGVGSFLGVNGINNYTIEDPCGCALSGNVLELHDDNFVHPYGQHEVARSNPVDLVGLSLPGTGVRSISATWSQYTDLPNANGVFYRPGWDYYPFTCPITGADGWSGRVGQNSFFFSGMDPVCSEQRNSGTASDNPVPSDAEQVRFLYEVYASCDAFVISDEACTDITNFTPLIDNIRVEVTELPDAPVLSLLPGMRFQDGFAQGTPVNDPGEPGNADVTLNINGGDTPPIILGDSLIVSGPLGGALAPSGLDAYDVQLWLQIVRAGPLADSRYRNWRDKVADGKDIEVEDSAATGGAAQWANSLMDSVEVGTNVSSNKFATYFREDDDDFDGGFPDYSEAQEIIPDRVLFPGTEVRYFFSGNWAGNMQRFLVPDTTGGNWLEFSILPMWKAGPSPSGTLRYPCLLYVDAAEDGAQPLIESALDVLGVEADRYDYYDATSSFKAPLARGLGAESNNGCTLPQLLGYRGVVVNSGSRNSGLLMWPSDFLHFSDWLTAEICDGLTSRQGLILNGDGIANAMNQQGAALLTQVGGTFVDDHYADFSGDENYCVRLEAPDQGGNDYDTANSFTNYEYDAYGNWCPEAFSFDVLGTTGSGVGNRVYLDVDDLVTETEFAQITNEDTSSDNYRTILDGVSYHHLSSVDVIEECVGDSSHIVTAAFNEILAGLEWIYGVGSIPSLCEDPCTLTDAVDPPRMGASAVTRLGRSSPNPFNRRTELRFTVAQEGELELSIFDASGREVRRLAQGKLSAGSHRLVWDGTDDQGRVLASGVYWARISDGLQTSSGKLIRLE